MSFPEIKTLFLLRKLLGQHDELKLEELGLKHLGELIENHYYERKIDLVEDNAGTGHVSSEIKEPNIVTTETLDQDQNNEDLFMIGHVGIYRVSMMKSVEEIWICSSLQQAQRRELRRFMTEFYQAAPEGYSVSDKSLCLTGRLMAVKYKDMGFFRAVIQKNVAETEKLVTVQHLDYGTKENVNVEDLFFLHRKFLAWPILVTHVR